MKKNKKADLRIWLTFIFQQVSAFSWKDEWIAFLLVELLDIILFFHVGVTFGPLNDEMLVRAFNSARNE
jgi:hypothetical protein